MNVESNEITILEEGRSYCMQMLSRPFSWKIKSDTKKRELLKNPTKIEEIQEKKFIDRN